MNKLLNNLKMNKEGLILGLVFGYLIGKYFLPNYIDFSIVTNSMGIIDYLKGTTTKTLEIAKNNIIIASTIIGGLAGYIIDTKLPEGWWRR